MKKYLTRASLVVGAILLTAMTVKLLPFTALAMSIMHIAMYATTGMGLFGYAEERYAQYKKKKKDEKHTKHLQFFHTEMRGISTFFSNRATSVSLSDKKPVIERRLSV